METKNSFWNMRSEFWACSTGWDIWHPYERGFTQNMKLMLWQRQCCTLCDVRPRGEDSVKRNPANMHFVALWNHLKAPTRKWLNNRSDMTLDFWPFNEKNLIECLPILLKEHFHSLYHSIYPKHLSCFLYIQCKTFI